jgi:hypothetical protein
MFGQLQDARIPGGCEHCDAYQTAEPLEAKVWRIAVHHDDRCPWMNSAVKTGRST